MQPRIALLLALTLLMAACGGGRSSGADPASGSISGNWQMSLEKSKPKLKRTQAGFLLQSGDAVTGGLLFSDFPCSGVGSVSGTVTGTDISLVVDPTGTTLNLTGTVSSNQTSMSGDYTLLASGCGGTETGTWTAELVKPLSGSFQGTFTSNRLGALPVTGRVTQASNTGVSNASLSGNLSITGYCFASANISGLVSGTAVVMNLVNSGGVEIAQVTGTSSLDGTTVTGTYHVIPQGPGGTSPCVDGDGGTVTLTL